MEEEEVLSWNSFRTPEDVDRYHGQLLQMSADVRPGDMACTHLLRILIMMADRDGAFTQVMGDAWEVLDLPLDMSVVLSELHSSAVVRPSSGPVSVDEHKLAKHLVDELKKNNLIVGTTSDSVSSSSPVPKGKKGQKKKGEVPHRKCGDADCDKILAHLMAFIKAKLIVRAYELGFHDSLDALLINMAAYFSISFNRVVFDSTLKSHQIFKKKAQNAVRSAKSTTLSRIGTSVLIEFPALPREGLWKKEPTVELFDAHQLAMEEQGVPKVETDGQLADLADRFRVRGIVVPFDLLFALLLLHYSSGQLCCGRKEWHGQFYEGDGTAQRIPSPFACCICHALQRFGSAAATSRCGCSPFSRGSVCCCRSSVLSVWSCSGRNQPPSWKGQGGGPSRYCSFSSFRQIVSSTFFRSSS